MSKTYLFFVLFCALAFTSCQPKPERDPIPYSVNADFSDIFRQYGLPNGAFLMWRKSEGFFRTYNEARNQLMCLPASTFKIPNTLIGLETGAIQDENTMFKWDGTKRSIETWNQDTNLAMAFKNSTVWYYQDIARRVGMEKMQAWINKLNYGNRNIGGGIDAFWLTGDIRISSYQQIDFLKQIQANELPVSQHSLDVLKRIMIREQTPDYVLRGKTGWGLGKKGQPDIGWFVGYVESKVDTTFFALNVESPIPSPDNFASARIDITTAILKRMKVIF